MKQWWQHQHHLFCSSREEEDETRRKHITQQHSCAKIVNLNKIFLRGESEPLDWSLVEFSAIERH